MNTTQTLTAAVAALALAGLYLVLRPDVAGDVPVAHGGPAKHGVLPAAAAPASSPAAAGPLVLDVDRPTGASIAVRQGDTVRFAVRSSQPGGINVHGLLADEFPVRPGAPAQVALEAGSPGSFAVHFHGPRGEHVPLATLEVGARP
jgi:hypothetical protein